MFGHVIVIGNRNTGLSGVDSPPERGACTDALEGGL
jgi:hypothetical protein